MAATTDRARKVNLADAEAAAGTTPAVAGSPRRRARRLGSGDAILEASTRLFLEKGYQATGMDEIAAAAGVSKQTIYTHFKNKEELFAQLVLRNAERVESLVAELPPIARDADDLAAGLEELARRYLRFVIRPEVLRLRRLVIGEAGRFPDLARAYFAAVPTRVYATLAALFADLDRDGRLRVPEPSVAAHHFAWLLLGAPLDSAMFVADDPAADDLDAVASEAVRVFLAAYRP